MTMTQELFNFWKDNKVDQHYQLNSDELTKKFSEWLPTKEKPWLQHRSADRVIRYFIAIDDKGLNSVFDEKEYNAIYALLKQEYLNIFYLK